MNIHIGPQKITYISNNRNIISSFEEYRIHSRGNVIISGAFCRRVERNVFAREYRNARLVRANIL